MNHRQKFLKHENALKDMRTYTKGWLNQSSGYPPFPFFSFALFAENPCIFKTFAKPLQQTKVM
jgi:hypothetical protein